MGFHSRTIGPTGEATGTFPYGTVELVYVVHEEADSSSDQLESERVVVEGSIIKYTERLNQAVVVQELQTIAVVFSRCVFDSRSCYKFIVDPRQPRLSRGQSSRTFHLAYLPISALLHQLPDGRRATSPNAMSTSTSEIVASFLGAETKSFGISAIEYQLKLLGPLLSS